MISKYAVEFAIQIQVYKPIPLKGRSLIINGDPKVPFPPDKYVQLVQLLDVLNPLIKILGESDAIGVACKRSGDITVEFATKLQRLPRNINTINIVGIFLK
jgi:hypothetical protein